MLILEHLLADGIDHLRNIQHRHSSQRGGRGIDRLISLGGALPSAVGHDRYGLVSGFLCFIGAINRCQ